MEEEQAHDIKCPELTKTKYQPRGTATLVTTSKINTVCASDGDKYGRWSFVMLKGKYKRKVTVITAHGVCQNTLATAGGNTCWMQQWYALWKKGITVPDPCKQFMTDFE
eukprot:3949705-Ditylum_brightwellii.AAC.1